MDGIFRVGGASCSIQTVDKMLPRLCLLARRSKWMLFLYVSLMEVFSGLRTMWYKLGWEVENKSSVNGMFFVTSPLLSLSFYLPPQACRSRGCQASPDFGWSVNPISTSGGRYMPIKLLLAPPYFQTFLRPWLPPSLCWVSATFSIREEV